MDRRRFIVMAGVASWSSLAGCTDPTDQSGDENTDDDGDGSNQTGGNGDNPRLEEVLNWESSFEMEYELDDDSGHGVFYESDYHWTWTEDGDTVETYRVDGEHYVVIEENCYQASGETPDADLTEPEQIEEEYGDEVATGRTTINDEEVYEFDVNGWTYYLSVETGYPVQAIDEDGGTATFHSWGETDPISPPDMECGGTPEENESSVNASTDDDGEDDG